MVDESNVVYSPSKGDIKSIRGAFYWEVWKGLPSVKFEEVTYDGKTSPWVTGLKYEGDDASIWIPSNAREAHEENPETTFVALLEKNRKKKVVRLVRASQENLEATVAHAEILNQKHMKPSRSA